jgi:hypothetical protein
MVFRFVEKGKRKPTWHEMMHAIMRNFGGLDGKSVNPIESFRRNFAAVDFGEVYLILSIRYCLLICQFQIFAKSSSKNVFTTYVDFMYEVLS